MWASLATVTESQETTLSPARYYIFLNGFPWLRHEDANLPCLGGDLQNILNNLKRAPYAIFRESVGGF